jgi:zinc-binding alcohol dehydrogenase/oxidoreductase
VKAIVVHGAGDLTAVRAEETNAPSPGTGEVLVRLRAAALNHRDLFICLGQYAGLKYPIIPGSDGVGEIAAVGPNVTNIREGDQVIINPSLDWGQDQSIQGPNWRILGLPDNGTFAEYVVVPTNSIYQRPMHLSDTEAAAIPLAGLTAYRAVITRGQVQPGETVLVLGIGGGVATFAMLFALQREARVIVTSGSDTKLERAHMLGASDGFNYHDSSWLDKVRTATDGQGPDLIIDGTGGKVFDQALDIVRPGGRVVTYGATLGPVPEVTVRRIFWKQLNIFGSTMGSPEDFGGMLALIDEAQLHPVIDREYPLGEASMALTHMHDAGQFGKIVLKI